MEEKISVIIPNYNGRHLLEKNLPKVLKECEGCEIIVVDDASSDDSVKFLEKKYTKIKIIRHKKNMGFAATANLGVSIASHKLVLLLNSDVSPKENFLKNLRNYFSKDKNLFAIALADVSHENKKEIIRGKGVAKFEKGLFVHSKGASTYGETLWVSGGSGLFDKAKFQQLGGFDTIYAPFYWEDIDLSYRAWKKGYSCLFVPSSKVDHYHQEGAINLTKSKTYIKRISYKNQFIFIWKNISYPWFLILHIIWLPYHLTLALTRLDVPFFLGFSMAVLSLPSLVFSKDDQKFLLTDKEVLNKFAK